LDALDKQLTSLEAQNQGLIEENRRIKKELSDSLKSLKEKENTAAKLQNEIKSKN
jgi:hypothetical protein